MIKIWRVIGILWVPLLLGFGCSHDSTGPNNQCLTFEYDKGGEWCCVYEITIRYTCDEEIDYFDIDLYDKERQQIFETHHMSAEYGDHCGWNQCFCSFNPEFECATGEFEVRITATDEKGKEHHAEFPMNVNCP